MTRAELVTLKANLIGGMNEYIKALENEEVYDSWVSCIPENITEDECMLIADDEAYFRTVCRKFGSLMWYSNEYRDN